MSNDSQKPRKRLFSTQEIISVGAALSRSDHLCYAAIASQGTEDAVVLHRSVYRDYFRLAFDHLFSPENALTVESVRQFYGEFEGRFLSGRFDLVDTRMTDQIAHENGWINPFGWDCKTGDVVRPLTALFKEAMLYAALLKKFHDRAISAEVPLSAYQRDVINYVIDDIAADLSEPRIYDPVVQTQLQVATYALRIREEFEYVAEREMMIEDWRALVPDMRRMFIAKASGSRVSNFKSKIAACGAKDPFRFEKGEKGSIVKLTQNSPDSSEVVRLAERMGLGGFIEYYGDQPVTGCPALRTYHSGIGNLVGLLTGSFLDAIAYDFWPQPESDRSNGCPFHLAPSK